MINIKEDKFMNKSLNINVIEQSSHFISFILKPSTKMVNIMDAYCHRYGLRKKSIRLIYRGEAIQEDDTPASLMLEDMDEIIAIVEQYGGS